MRYIYRTVLLAASALLLALLPGARAYAADERCFPETGYCVAGRFREYWEQNGGLAVFGFPTTPARDERNRDTGQTYLTQWFERNRFELHPENAAPYDVLLGRLSDERLRLMGVDWQVQPREGGPRPGCLWFDQTGHNVCDQAGGLGFKSYWQAHGLRDPRLDAHGRSLALLGLPLTEATEQVSPWDGRVYLIQWFERARFEWHPDEPDAYKVLLGLLGNEVRMNTADASERGQIAFVRDGDVHVMSAGGGNLARYSNVGGVEGQPVWSPHATWIAFTARGELYIVRRDGVDQTALTSGAATDAIVRSPTWSSAGQHIAFERDWDIFVVDIRNGRLANLTNTPAPAEEYGPAWSPDGQRIAFVRNGDFFVMNADGSDQRQLTRDMHAGAAPQWSPDGGRLLLAAYKQWGDSEIYTVNADGSGLTNLTNNSWIDDTAPAWSPDGTRIAFESNRDAPVEAEIYVMNADGSQASRLTNNHARDTSITWSPDGARIAFASNRGGDFAVYAMRADGAEQLFLAAGAAPAWSPQ